MHLHLIVLLKIAWQSPNLFLYVGKKRQVQFVYTLFLRTGMTKGAAVQGRTPSSKNLSPLLQSSDPLRRLAPFFGDHAVCSCGCLRCKGQCKKMTRVSTSTSSYFTCMADVRSRKALSPREGVAVLVPALFSRQCLPDP